MLVKSGLAIVVAAFSISILLAGNDDANIVGSVATRLVVSTPGFSPVTLEQVKLCRYSKDLSRWVADFHATRLFEFGRLNDQIDLSVQINLKNGSHVSFSARDESGTREYWVPNDGSYKPEDVASFQISIIRDSAIEKRLADQEQKKEDAKVAAKIRALKTQERQACRDVYHRTADKKVSDLTVRESKQVQACERLGMYPPE